MRRFFRHLDGVSTRRAALYLTVLFIVSRLVFYLVGVRFDATPLPTFWAYLDPPLLQHKLAESLFYLHSQPPLFNLFLGVILKAFPGNYAAAFNAVYLSAGWALCLALYRLQTSLGVSKAIALLIAALFTVSPYCILYENWLFYTYIITLLLVLTTLAFYRYLESGKGRYLLTLFSLIFVISGIRSLYHIIFFVAVFVLLFILRPRDLKRQLLTAAGPFSLLLLLYLKNFILFGIFTTSSWFGMNLAAMTTMNLPIAEREAMVEKGDLSPLALIPRFSPIADYPPEYATDGRYPDVVALHGEFKADGSKNMNHIAYIGISRQYQEDALAVLRAQPQIYLVTLAKAWHIYFRPSGDLCFLNDTGNRDRIASWVDVFDYGASGKIPYDLRFIGPLSDVSVSPLYVYLFNTLGLPFLLVFGLIVSFRRTRGSDPVVSDAQKYAVLFTCINILYVAILGNAMDYSENMRFRFTTDPLSLVLLGLCLQHWIMPVIRGMRRNIYGPDEEG